MMSQQSLIPVPCLVLTCVLAACDAPGGPEPYADIDGDLEGAPLFYRSVGYAFEGSRGGDGLPAEYFLVLLLSPDADACADAQALSLLWLDPQDGGAQASGVYVLDSRLAESRFAARATVQLEQRPAGVPYGWESAVAGTVELDFYPVDAFGGPLDQPSGQASGTFAARRCATRDLIEGEPGVYDCGWDQWCAAGRVYTRDLTGRWGGCETRRLPTVSAECAGGCAGVEGEVSWVETYEELTDGSALCAP